MSDMWENSNEWKICEWCVFLVEKGKEQLS